MLAVMGEDVGGTAYMGRAVICRSADQFLRLYWHKLLFVCTSVYSCAGVVRSVDSSLTETLSKCVS